MGSKDLHKSTVENRFKTIYCLVSAWRDRTKALSLQILYYGCDRRALSQPEFTTVTVAHEYGVPKIGRPMVAVDIEQIFFDKLRLRLVGSNVVFVASDLVLWM